MISWPVDDLLVLLELVWRVELPLRLELLFGKLAKERLLVEVILDRHEVLDDILVHIKFRLTSLHGGGDTACLFPFVWFVSADAFFYYFKLFCLALRHLHIVPLNKWLVIIENPR